MNVHKVKHYWNVKNVRKVYVSIVLKHYMQNKYNIHMKYYYINQ